MSWFNKLRDRQAKTRIIARIRLVCLGNLGDMKQSRDCVFELRIDYGPGYQPYCTRHGQAVIVLLAGGDKSTQDADIERAFIIAKEWRK